MGATTEIAWTDATMNPWIGCSRVSPGCEHCYAETQANFRKAWGVTWGPNGNRRMASETTWRQPLLWDRAARAEGKRRRVFCASLADVFEEGRWPELQNGRARLFDLIEKTPGLDWQLLTKRPQNVLGMIPASWRAFLPPNVWIGTTVEDQKRANERIYELLKIPARVRFLSCEPLLWHVDLEDVRFQWHNPSSGRDVEVRMSGLRGAKLALPPDPVSRGVDWVIVGGESGGGARPFDLAWARAIVAQCRLARVPVFVKQMGDRPVDSEWRNGVYAPEDKRSIAAADSLRIGGSPPNLVLLRTRKGGDWNEWPEDLRVREFPRSAA